jgi:hypothetical protein
MEDGQQWVDEDMAGSIGLFLLLAAVAIVSVIILSMRAEEAS